MQGWITLADYAQVHAGKLYIVGGGVSAASTPLQLGVGIELGVAWTDRSKSIKFVIDMIDAAGNQVLAPAVVPGVAGMPLKMTGQLVVNPALGVKPGSVISAVLAFQINGLPLPPDSTFTIRLFLENDDKPTLEKSFSTVARIMVPPPG